MKINGYLFPKNNQCEFLSAEKKISGHQWSKECLALAADIARYRESNWLLYQDDFYQYAKFFFALLLAGKNIVLAQSGQTSRVNQAAAIADITIGDITATNLPHFIHTKTPYKAINDLELNSLELSANNSITLFTSGSSGEAKAIKKYWYQLVNEIETLAELFDDEGQQKTIVATVTHKHIYGLLFKLLWPVFTNKKIVSETVEYPEQAENYLQNLTDVFFISSPSYLSRSTEYFSKKSIANIARVFSSGGALADTISNLFFDKYQQTIIEVYGSTETGGIAWREQVTNANWLLFPHHSVDISPDKTLILSSNFLEQGTSIKTDDQVSLNGRYFKLIGRVDRIIKLHEKRLSLDEMEQQLKRSPLVDSCYCTIIITNKDQLVTLIKLTNKDQLPANIKEKKLLINQLKSTLSEKFETSLLPKKWRFVEEIPYNSQGKLIKAEITALFT